MPNEDDFLHIEGLKTKRIPKHERKFFGRQEKVDQKGIAGRGAASFGGWHLKYMKVKITYEGGQQIERSFVSEEALMNALCHKQYQSGMPIQISVYEDKLYITNCGCLPEN